MRDIAALTADIHAGRADPGEAVAEAEAAIAAHNGLLNAVVDHDPQDAAGQLDALRARLRAGERPPLAGVPVTVKDHIHVRGWRATEGSTLLRDRVATADDPAVARLRAAGAILIGRTNMSEFGCKGVTTNRVYGPTRHHLDPRLTPGGSSGGAAVATATGMCALALASDGGGSIRRPAAHAGVIGFKPSTGAVASAALSHTSVTGLLGRSVTDLAGAFAVLRGAHAADPVSVDFARAPCHPRTLRLGFAPTLGLPVAMDDAAAAAAGGAVARIRAAGFTVVPAAPAWPPDASEARLMPLQHAGLAARWGADWRRDPEAFDPDIAVQIEAGLALTGADVAAADAFSRLVATAAAAFFADGPDLLLAPTTPCVAWPLDRLGPERIGGAPAGPRDHAALTPLINHAFLPAISIPCGTDAAGLPLGLQIIGPRFSDDLVLATAASLADIAAG
jgi:aspartyl-tRNA(Asn)/glutamyl-tRNA(Gln) amidotransferase subunit A